MKRINVLMVASEMAPFAKVGGLADVVGTLPRHLNANGCDARVILPLYKKIKERYAEQLVFLHWSMLKMGWRTLYSGLFQMDYDGVTVYFIDNEYYFGHDAIYLDYSFDIERFSFFQRAVLAAMGAPMGFQPDVVHCNDWQAGMIPCLLDAHYRELGCHLDVKTVFTIHNLKYQGIHGVENIADLMDLPPRFMTEEQVLKDGVPNFMKAGIVFADKITTVSPTYAIEIMSTQYGEGLDSVLRQFAFKVAGIQNGIDVVEFDPATDPLIPRMYHAENWREGKAVCKHHLQEELGLAADPAMPMAAMISRLVDQKGLDLLIHVLDEMIDSGMQVVVQGTGDPFYEWLLAETASRHPGRMAVVIAYDNALAHRIYAAADLFLMPSLFEPCGLSQMVAMRYGTVPIVRETGGLKDTVCPYDRITGKGNGFSFSSPVPEEFLAAVKAAGGLYRENRAAWDALVQRDMAGDYSWDSSAAEYTGLFSSVTGISPEAAC